MKKKGQEIFGMSFSVIFSVLIIIAIIGVAVYAITHFLSLNNCAQIGMFYDDFQSEITQAWKDEIYEDTFVVKLPKEVETICFGTLSQQTTFAPDISIQNELIAKSGSSEDAYVFLIPKKDKEICEGLSRLKLQHAQASAEDGSSPDPDKFFCKPAADLSTQEKTIQLKISSTESLVSISK
ncbi:hypothetical protein J4402_00140 [Candidatus Pacearchaeota archaeon]|nr:hypothetical protein [Candidatus Pacearchaeota archaeon]